jgi:hypothetical protein
MIEGMIDETTEEIIVEITEGMTEETTVIVHINHHPDDVGVVKIKQKTATD